MDGQGAPLALVTGAAGGLGSTFARELEARGYELILTDQTVPPDDPRWVRADLADPQATDALGRLAADRGVSLLVNCAGFGTYTMFADADLDRQLAMVRVHVDAAVRLTHAVLPGMLERRAGAIINVSSAGAFMRFPRDATYIGTKAFLLAFTECLAIELVGTGVKAQALCPAWVRTPFASSGDLAGYVSPIPDFLHTTPDVVVRASLTALEGDRVRVIPTLRGALASRALGSRPGLAALAWIRRRRASPGRSPASRR